MALAEQPHAIEITFKSNVFPLFHPVALEDLKDPCPGF